MLTKYASEIYELAVEYCQYGFVVVFAYDIYEYNQGFLTKPIYYLQVGQFGDCAI